MKISEVEYQYKHGKGDKIIVHRNNQAHTYRYSIKRFRAFDSFFSYHIVLYPGKTLDGSTCTIDVIR